MGAGVGREGGARGARLWRAGRSAAGGGDAAASDLQIKGGGARQATVKGTAAGKAIQFVAPPHEPSSVRYMAHNPRRLHAFGLLRHHMLVLADARDAHNSFGNYEMFITGLGDVADIFESIVIGVRVTYDDNGGDGDDADVLTLDLRPCPLLV